LRAALQARLCAGQSSGLEDGAAGRRNTPFFRGEFGAEFLLALPAAYAAWRRGALVETRGCGDMAPFYYFSGANQCVSRVCGAALRALRAARACVLC
jgi:hypothetical protein